MADTRELTSGGREWLLGLTLGAILFLGVASPVIHSEIKRNKKEQQVIAEIERNHLYQTKRIYIPAVEQGYTVSDLDGDGEADTVYVTINPDNPSAIYHRRDLYRKGDSDFENVLNEAKSVLGSSGEM